MITSLFLRETACTDPYENLALEQALLESVLPGQCILYLWQNENTVVIGKNQNPWKECKTALLQQEGGKLARRLSGGGAVFHDLGNLNFTFLMSQEDFCTDKQLTVIQTALDSLGIPCQRSGRNDILADGRKFSGNAFYKNGKQAYHHGTLLVSADMNKLSRYLSPSKAKLRSKGVDSVRSRVVNLREFRPDLTVEMLKSSLISAFSQVYGHETIRMPASSPDPARIHVLTERNRSWEWNFGQKLPFTLECEDRFSWGSLHVQLQIENGIIRCAKVFTDAMDWAIAPELEARLTGCVFHRDALAERLGTGGISSDLLSSLERTCL